MFNLAGVLGHFFISTSLNLWGIIGYIVPIIFIFYGLAFILPKKITLSSVSVVGMILTLIFLPALISPAGGFFGAFIRSLFEKMIGLYASLIVLFGLTIVSILITLNTSLKNLWEKFVPENVLDNAQVKVNEPRANVFATCLLYTSDAADE